jgi:hypothetical protein
MRCPMDGTQEPEDEDNPVCPVTIRRTIAGMKYPTGSPPIRTTTPSAGWFACRPAGWLHG